jgi:endoglucanase
MRNRGVNIAYEVVQGTVPWAYKDINRLKGCGIDHIRLPFRPVDFFTNNTYATINDTNKTKFDTVKNLALDNGLSVILDCHGIDPTDVSDSYNGMATIWNKVGNAYKGDPVADENNLGVYFEMFNEPQESDAGNWATKHEATITAIRAIDTKHWLIADGLYGADPNGFDALSPLSDNKVIYSYHFYENYEFTHCGAEWTGMNGLSGLRYPTPAAQANAKLNAIGYTTPTISRYMGYNRDNMLEQVMDHPVTWAETHNVPMYCGEMGFYDKHTRLEDGYAWMQDAIWTMSQADVSYCLFVYGAPDGSWPIDDTILGMVQAERMKNPQREENQIYSAGRPVSDLNSLSTAMNVNNRRVSIQNPVPVQMGNGNYHQFDYGIEHAINYSVTVLQANPFRKGFSIQNQSTTATGWLRIDNDADATKDGWSWKLAPGKTFPEGPISVAPTNKISLISDQTGTPSTGDTYHHFNVIEIT